MLSAENQRLRSPTSQPVDHRTLGKYELIARIGKGGMAEVFLARQRGPMNFEKVVVVKTIHPHLAAQKEFIDMLLDEARIAALLKHPCVVDIYDLGTEGETYFIAMEHLSGQPLLAVLRAGRKNKRPLPVHSTCRIISDVADGLHSAHELKDSAGRQLDLVHRDITPGNIIVLYNGQVKIVDFGIAKARGRMAMETNARQLKGKLGYVAPEQIRNQPVDRRADIFALGVVMWEALTYRRLFRGNDPGAVLTDILKKAVTPPSVHRPDVPAELDQICLRALARDPAERYGEASELHADLEKFLAQAGASLQKRAIADYMGKLFTGELAEHERLLRETARARSMIDAMPRRPGSFAEESSGAGLPAGVSRAASESDGGQPGGALGTARDSAPAPAAAPPAGPGTSRPAPSAPDLRQSAQMAQQRPSYPTIDRSSHPALQRPSDAALQRPSDAALQRVSDPSMGSIALPAPDAVGARSAQNARRRRWIIGGITGGVFVLLLAFGLASEDPAQDVPALDDLSGKTTRTPGAGDVLADGPKQQLSGEQTGAVAAPPPAGPMQAAADPAEPVMVMAAKPDHPPASKPGPKAPLQAGEPDTGTAAATPAAALPAGSDGQGEDEPEVDATARLEAHTLYKEGLALFIRGDTATAQQKFQTAVRIWPGYAQAYRGLGMVYERTGQKEKAAGAFRTYLRLAPDAGDRDAILKRLSDLEG